jgi:hypothetical protein
MADRSLQIRRRHRGAALAGVAQRRPPVHRCWPRPITAAATRGATSIPATTSPPARRNSGSTDPQLPAIRAIGFFKKERFADAIRHFLTYVTEQSGHATQHMLGLAYLYNHQPKEALPWLKRAGEIAARPTRAYKRRPL